MCLIPLITQLNGSNTGYQIRSSKMKINARINVDDLKLISKNNPDIEEQLKIVKEFSMNFSLVNARKHL